MKIQKPLNINTGGSLQNIIMSCNSSLPVKGEKATILFYTDRRVVEVTNVSNDLNTVTLDNGSTLVFKKDNWFIKSQTVEFTKEFNNWINNNYKEWLNIKNDFFDENNKLLIIKGKTKLVNNFNKINIVFGLDDAYTDPSF